MTDSHTSMNTEGAPEQLMIPRGESRSRRLDSDVPCELMGSGQGPKITKEVERCDAANYLPQRAAKAGEPFVGERLIIPVGTYEVRNNGYTYRFRTYNALAYLSGLGGGHEPDFVFTLEPKENGSRGAIPYFKPRTLRSTQEFHSNPQHGEFWIGARPSLEEVHQEVGLRCARIDTSPDALAKDTGRVKLYIVRGVDASIEAMADGVREQVGLLFDEEARSADETSEKRLSEIRLREDAFKLTELARAVEVIRVSFEDTV